MREEAVCVAMTTAVNKLLTVAELRVVVVARQRVGTFTSVRSQLTDL